MGGSRNRLLKMRWVVICDEAGLKCHQTASVGRALAYSHKFVRPWVWSPALKLGWIPEIWEIKGNSHCGLAR